MDGPVLIDDSCADVARDHRATDHQPGGSTASADDPSATVRPCASIVRCGTRVTVVSVAGDIDLASADLFSPVLNGALSAETGGRVVVELNRVTFLSARGLGVLLEAHHSARRSGTEFVLVVDQVAPAAATLRHLPAAVLPVTLPTLTEAVRTDGTGS